MCPVNRKQKPKPIRSRGGKQPPADTPSSDGNGQTSIPSPASAVAVESQEASPLADLLKKSIALEQRRKKVERPEFDSEPSPDDPVEAVGLKGDQLRAFREIDHLLGTEQQVVKLCGYAGTGKTYLLARIAERAKHRGFEVTIAAPTHKAAGVIQEKLGADIEVRTIHSLLGLRLEPDYENDTGGRVLQATDTKSKVKEGALVICDEASMVGSVLKEHIDASPGVRWVFVGDLAQLPPVGESTSELLDDPDSTLEEVLRQAHGSEILNLATRIRKGDTSMEFRPGFDVCEVSSAEDLFQEALRRFDSAEFRNDASHARMLVFRNDRRRAINSRIRTLLVGKPDPYVKGEWLVMYQAFSPEKSKLNVLAERAKIRGGGSAWRPFFDYKKTLGATITQLHVSEEVLVRSAVQSEIEVDQWKFPVWKLNVFAKDHGEVFELPVLREDQVEKVEQLKAEQAEAARTARTERDSYEPGCRQWQEFDSRRKRAWSLFFSLEETFAQVDYCYAMTVYKSQGSTFEHAFVDVPDLMRSGGMQQKILYTAFTRPAKSVTFYK